MWRQQQVLSRACADGGLGDCRPLVVGLRLCSFCGVLSWYAKPPGHIIGGSGGSSLQPKPSPSHASHLWRVLLLLTVGHSLRSGPFCVPLDDDPMSSLFDQCTPFRSYCTGSDTPHLSAVVGVWDLLGASKSDGGCGEVESRCRPLRGLESSVLSLIGVGHTVGWLWPWVCLTPRVGGDVLWVSSSWWPILWGTHSSSLSLIQYMHACILSHITFWRHHHHPR